jgi:peptide/nickel transport system permease protein
MSGRAPRVPAAATTAAASGSPADLAAGRQPARGLQHAGDRHAAQVWRRLLRKPAFVIGTAIVLLWAIAAIFWPLLVPDNPLATDPFRVLRAPSALHLLGTDELGRDVLSRLLAGAEPVLTMAPLATAVAVSAGTVIGLAAGYYRGLFDEVLMRTVDALLAFPSLIIAVVVLGLTGTSEISVVLLVGLSFSPLVARTVRSAAIAQRERDYLRAAKLRGESPLYEMFAEILPNITGPILVEATVRLGYAIFFVATLSFLGLGPQPPSPDWGLTVATERIYTQFAPWTVLAPAAAIGSLVVGVNLAADALRQELQD